MSQSTNPEPRFPSRHHKKWGPTLIAAFEQHHEQSPLLASYAEDIERIRAYPSADHNLSAALEAQAKTIAQRNAAIEQLKRRLAGWATRLGKDRPQLVTRNFVDLRDDPTRALAAGQELIALAQGDEPYTEQLHAQIGEGVTELEAAMAAAEEAKTTLRDAQRERRELARLIETLRHPVRLILIELLGRSAPQVRTLTRPTQRRVVEAVEEEGATVSLVSGTVPQDSTAGGDEQAA